MESFTVSTLTRNNESCTWELERNPKWDKKGAIGPAGTNGPNGTNSTNGTNRDTHGTNGHHLDMNDRNNTHILRELYAGMYK